MCGVTGFIDFTKTTKRENLLEIVGRMSDRLVHRGPDDYGAWVDEKCGIALGFRRLAIIDLSIEGRQPMVSADGRYTAVFNGEIYNFPELREELEALGHRFRGHSDTEVMLAAFVQWEIEETLKRLNGMFAIAVWDAQSEELTLIRDRVGKKPLYYGKFGETFVFGSELKSLMPHSAFQTEVDPHSLGLYLKFGYVPSPRSIFKNVEKVAPGHLVKINSKKGQIGEQSSYWSLQNTASEGIETPHTGSENEIFSEFEELMLNSVKRRMLADVPLGAFLSGGIDSSTIVALMQAQSSNPVKTFTIGFHEAKYNEAEHAKRIADFLKTEHHELYLSSRDALNVIPKLPTLFDEPFADSSQIPTFLLSIMARKFVTVSLSGDGGDELFGGYGRYFLAQDLWKKINRLPVSFRKKMGVITSLAGSGVDKFVSSAKNRKGTGFGQKLSLLSNVLKVKTEDELYLNLISLWQNPPVLNSNLNGAVNDFRFPKTADFMQRMMLRDALTYLPDDILVKVDRASMGVSLEVRAPILDYRVIEFSWRLPVNLKTGNGGKLLLKKLLKKHVPSEIWNRPKMGFEVPISSWLRGELRDWAEDLLNVDRLNREGFFNPVAIQIKWEQHLKGKRNWNNALWAVLMFQAWLDELKKNNLISITESNYPSLKP